MSSWASFQRRYEKLTAELRKETTESQTRKQLSTISGNHNSRGSGLPVEVVVYPVTSPDPPVLRISTSANDHLSDHRPLTPSPSPSEVPASDVRASGPHVTSLHVRDLTSVSSDTTAVTTSNTTLFNNNLIRESYNPFSSNNNNNCSSASSPSPGSLLTPPASKSISKSPSPNDVSETSSSSTTTSTTPSAPNPSQSPFSRSFFGGRFSLGKAGIGYRTLGLPQFLANLSLGSYASNSNIANERPDGERRTSTCSSASSSDPVVEPEVVKTAETVNRIMDTQCLSPRPLRPRPKDLRGLSLNSGGGRSSGRLRQDLSFLPNSPARSAVNHRRHSPSNPQDDGDSMRLSNKFPSNNTLTIDGQEYKISEQDFEILGELGAGSSGTVAKMSHKPTKRVIAVKMMRRSVDDEETKRIGNDLDILLKCSNCEHVVQCYGYMIKSVDVWICMELMSSCFEKLLKQGIQFPEPILGKVTVVTVKALNFLKENHKVIHRDVKPSNILINAAGRIKLCDFGISGRLIDSKAKTRQAGCTAYLAPERIQPEDPNFPTYDVRADVWSLGITLVELAMQKFPYEADSDFAVLSKIMADPPPALPADRFSAPFCDFVRQCLMKDTKSRPKYKKLLEIPFIQYYDSRPLDVAAWFATTGCQ